MNRYKKGNNFQECFEHFGRLGLFQVLLNLAICCDYSITNSVKIPVLNFFFSEKVNKEHLKMVNVNY